jgi:hypothetical protein
VVKEETGGSAMGKVVGGERTEEYAVGEGFWGELLWGAWLGVLAEAILD